ncbi:MAG: Crp/Fnr family transcriptional regulator [Clostridiales bacterium]|nr:Crp/Fnr family transcriptional regulator [Clostridiales bacterium]
MDSMYDILVDLPLFKGVGHDRISAMVGSTKMHFLKYLPGENIVVPNQVCTHLMFIISGSVRTSIANNSGRFNVSQTLTAPDVIAPEFLFGMSTHYPCTATAINATGILQIEKNDYINILNSDRVFLYNYLNLLSMNAQRGVNGILSFTTGSLDERLAYWVIALTQTTGTDISLICRQRDLYLLFGVQRSSFMATLDSMAERGLLTYEPGIIHFKNRSKLLDLLLHHAGS